MGFMSTLVFRIDRANVDAQFHLSTELIQNVGDKVEVILDPEDIEIDTTIAIG